MVSLPQSPKQRRVKEVSLRRAHSEAHLPKVSSSRNYSVDPLEIVTVCLTQMEATVLGLQQLQSYIGTEIGSHMLAILIEEADATITEIKQRMM